MLNKVLIISIMAFSSCSFNSEYFFIDEEIIDLTDARIIMNTKIDYEYKIFQSVKSPKETYESKRGDCFDQAGLFAYLVEMYLGWDVEIVGCLSTKGPHALVYYDGVYYEGQTGGEADMNKYIPVNRMTLEEFLGIANIRSLTWH